MLLHVNDTITVFVELLKKKKHSLINCKGVMFYPNNMAPRQKILHLKILKTSAKEENPHTIYSSDLAPSNYHCAKCLQN